MLRSAVSRVGTEIAYWSSGHGPPLVLVHGAPADHTRWNPLLPHLEPHVTVHATDRRGRGESGDGPEYDVRREFETVLRAELSEDDVRVMRSLPSWQARVAAAHSLPRELQVLLTTSFDAAKAARITVSTLLITGEVSTDPTKADIETVATAIPGARIVILDGQQHVADIADPKVFSKHLLAFLRDGR